VAKYNKKLNLKLITPLKNPASIHCKNFYEYSTPIIQCT